MIDAKLAMQAHRNYEMFKKAIEILTEKSRNFNLKEDVIEEQYVKAKADLYCINTKDYENDIIGLKQAIEELESAERKAHNQEISDYYHNRGI